MQTATFTAHPGSQVGAIDPRLFGSFVEHLGRAVCGAAIRGGRLTATLAPLSWNVIRLVKRLWKGTFHRSPAFAR